jgi:adenylate cyclase
LALGLPWPAPDQRTFSEADIEGLRGVKYLLDAGVPEDGVLEMVRVVGQASARVAASALQLFGDVFLHPGDTERDPGLRYADFATQVAPFIGTMLENPVLLHVREIIRREVVGQAERTSGRLPGARDVAVCFADLVGFTALGERLEASELGDVAGRLAEIAPTVAEPPVRLVKTIGDAVMLVSTDPSALLDAALSLVAAGDGDVPLLPPLRAGVAYGPALGRGGDWYGRPINLASRITGAAPRGNVLATAEARNAAGGSGYQWSPVPSRRFKGVETPVALFRVRPRPKDGARSP